MLQAVIKKGGVKVVEVTTPAIEDNNVLIEVMYSCVSFGTENSSIKNSGKTLFQKAKEKPEKVKKVVDKLLSDGPKETISMIKGELNVSTPSGYSLSGKVIQAGKNVTDFKIGDLVAAAGGTANHAQVVSVPYMLVSKIDQEKYVKHASTVAIGSIALHGVRRVANKLGEQCVVIGTGIIGLLSVQLLVKSGVRVCAIDLDEKKLDLAKKYGAELAVIPGESTVNIINNWSQGIGVDSVLICASSSGDKILSDAFNMCRRKGRVVLVGSVGMNINRADIYNKEIDFQISTSYGPGRYDENYEVKGNDYPISYVRWTEGRNMEEYLRLITSGSITIEEMITSEYEIKEANKAFSRTDEEELNLFTLLSYVNEKVEETPRFRNSLKTNKKNGKVNVGLIGAGSFTKNMMLPNLKKLSKTFQLRSIYSRTGVKAKDLLESFNGSFLVNSADEIYNDPEIDLVIITTNHGSHGEYVLKALESNKNVFVEKPLCVDIHSLEQIHSFYKQRTNEVPLLTVGFNRRFSRYAQVIKKQLDNRINPLIMYYRMNAGHLPAEHWVHSDGGRIIGECCHIIDLATFFTESHVISISYDYLSPKTNHIQTSDNRVITLKYQDGSVVHIQYFSVGNKALSKEYFEIHYDQNSIIVDDYKSITSYGTSIKNFKTTNSEKGHFEIMKKLGESLSSDKPDWVIPLRTLLETTEATLEIAKD